MRTLGLMIATLPFVISPAMAQSKWVESKSLDPAAVGAHCKRASDVQSLARWQMITAGDTRWMRLARQELVVEAFVMGAPPLDPGRCYVVARAGRAQESERRAFEVYDFAVNAEKTTVFVIGHTFQLPSNSGKPNR